MATRIFQLNGVKQQNQLEGRELLLDGLKLVLLEVGKQQY